MYIYGSSGCECVLNRKLLKKKNPAKKLICRTNNMNRLKRIILKIKTTLPTNNPNKTKKNIRVSKTRALCALYYCDKKIREKKKKTMFKQKPFTQEFSIARFTLQCKNKKIKKSQISALNICYHLNDILKKNNN